MRRPSVQSILRWRPPVIGYDSPILLDLVKRKTALWRATPNQPDPWLPQYAGARVVDVGGAFGTDYWRLGAPAIKWAVVEQPRIVALAQEWETAHVRWFVDLADAVRWLDGPVDLLWAASSLQYLRDPVDALRQWSAIGARQIAITRLPPFGAELRRVWQVSRLCDNGPGVTPPDVADRRVYYRRWILPETIFKPYPSILVRQDRN